MISLAADSGMDVEHEAGSDFVIADLARNAMLATDAIAEAPEES